MKTLEHRVKAEFPDLIERKTLPEYRRVRAKIVAAGLQKNAREVDFLLGQLDGRDFVNAWGALWALNETGRLKKKERDTLLEKAPSLIGHERWHVQEAAAEALGVTDGRAEDLLSRAYEDGRRMYPVRQAAARSLARIGSVDKLLDFSRDGGEGASVPAIEALGLVGRSVISELEDIAKSTAPPDPRVYAAYVSLSRNPECLGRLEETAGDDRSDYRFYAVKALGNMGARAVPALGRLALGEPSKLRDEAVESLGRIGEPAFEALAEVAKRSDDARMRGIVAGLLCSVGSKARPLLEEMAAPKEDSWVRSAAQDSLRLIRYDRKGIMRGIVYSEEPAFATPSSIPNINRLSGIAEISRRLRERDKGVVGVIVVGSSALGYLEDDVETRVSDLDYGILCDGPEAARAVADFKRLAKAKRIRTDPAATSGGVLGLIGDRDADMLFRGLFFGDRERLRDAQRNALSEVGRGGWDDLRESMLLRVDYRKLRRFGFTDEESGQVEFLRSLLWTPPDFETMKAELTV